MFVDSPADVALVGSPSNVVQIEGRSTLPAHTMYVSDLYDKAVEANAAHSSKHEVYATVVHGSRGK